MAKYTAIGGQALIEGILMKSPEKTAIAVRIPDKSIDITMLNAKGIREKYKILSLPVIRGIAGFVESMIQGYRAMTISAEKSGFTEIENNEKNSEDKKSNPDDSKKSEKKKNTFTAVIMAAATVLGIVLAIALFMYIPRIIVSGAEKIFSTEIKNPILRSSIEQLIKLAVFIIYIWVISLMKDIHRVFMYHGAEHKTIFCYEKGLELNVENVRIQCRFHPRCGTSFMILMILISIVFATVLQMIFPTVYDIPAVWVLAKILMIPLICGVGFEILRACGKYDNTLTRIISAPGLWMQRLTTKEPDDSMIEVAIAALRACEPEHPDVDRSIDIIKNQEMQPEIKPSGVSVKTDEYSKFHADTQIKGSVTEADNAEKNTDDSSNE